MTDRLVIFPILGNLNFSLEITSDMTVKLSTKSLVIFAAARLLGCYPSTMTGSHKSIYFFIYLFIGKGRGRVKSSLAAWQRGSGSVTSLEYSDPDSDSDSDPQFGKPSRGVGCKLLLHSPVDSRPICQIKGNEMK